MDERLRLRLEETLGYGPEHAAAMVEWLHKFAQDRGRLEARKQSGLAEGWQCIECALQCALRSLAGE